LQFEYLKKEQGVAVLNFVLVEANSANALMER
jgi:hypothetical protein